MSTITQSEEMGTPRNLDRLGRDRPKNYVPESTITRVEAEQVINQTRTIQAVAEKWMPW